MPDTTTTNLGLTKIEVGGSSDTWGGKINTNADTVDALFDTGPVLKVAKGGTGGATAADARTNLGLGTIATQAASAVAITGGTITGITDLAVADGGTGASDAATARTNLGAAASGAVTSSGLTVATDRLVGRDTASTGALEQISVSGGLEFTGSGGIQRSALTGDVTASAGSNATTIASNAVTTAKINDAAVTPAKLSGGQSGSAPAYAARAWVNFTGTGTVAINASGNVTSITDNGTGEYTVNFTTALPSANFAVSGACRRTGSSTRGTAFEVDPDSAPTTSSVRVRSISLDSDPAPVDASTVSVAVFG